MMRNISVVGEGSADGRERGRKSSADSRGGADNDDRDERRDEGVLNGRRRDLVLTEGRRDRVRSGRI